MLIIDNFTTVIPYIRCKLNKIVTAIPGQCEMKNIRYLGNQALPGVSKRAKCGQNANYRQFHYRNAIYSLQVEHNLYISPLQIYLDSVK